MPKDGLNKSERAVLKTAQRMVRELGLTLRYNRYLQEFRLNYLGGKEETAYYTNDLLDALGTAHHMAEDRKLQTGQ